MRSLYGAIVNYNKKEIMAISIDTVYQRVLAFANKEQRGYITPQEFNLFANQAQLEIFEQYFYDLNQAAKVPGNEYIYSDVDDMLEEKIQIFETVTNSITPVLIGNGFIVPDSIYRIHGIRFDGYNCEILKTLDFNEAKNGGPLTSPSDTRPIANISNNIINVVGSNNSPITPTEILYIRKPVEVAWGYFVINEKALYNVDATTDFELHDSEVSELVYKILKFAGISMKREDIMRAGQGMEMAQIQLEKQ